MLQWRQPAQGAKDNTKCYNGDNLPFGCTYRTDNDIVFNDNRASTATSASGGWRAVCGGAGAASQNFSVTLERNGSAGAEVAIRSCAWTMTRVA